MDQTTATPTLQNPLAKHFRQPSIYLKLPSAGTHWPEGSIDLPITGDIPILPMSTKDEIVLKTPDALLNGQGVVDVIQNCCPSIKDAWNMPSVDVDAVIIAIRIASYGNQMDFTSECPHCKTTNDYAVDLGIILSNITAPNYNTKLAVDDLKFKLKPQPYFSVNRSSMIAYEEQQILRSLGTLEDNPEEAKRIFNNNLTKLVDLNIQMLADSTDYIETADGSIVSDANFIQEFYKNCDTKIVKAIRIKLDEHSLYGSIKPVNVVCQNEECAKEFDITITFDFASFFAKGS
jgi:hypothetical protein